MLDVDVVLGYDDSGEGARGYPPTVAPQSQQPQWPKPTSDGKFPTPYIPAGHAGRRSNYVGDVERPYPLSIDNRYHSQTEHKSRFNPTQPHPPLQQIIPEEKRARSEAEQRDEPVKPLPSPPDSTDPTTSSLSKVDSSQEGGGRKSKGPLPLASVKFKVDKDGHVTLRRLTVEEASEARRNRGEKERKRLEEEAQDRFNKDRSVGSRSNGNSEHWRRGETEEETVRAGNEQQHRDKSKLKVTAGIIPNLWRGFKRAKEEAQQRRPNIYDQYPI